MSENKNEKGFLARNFGKALDNGVYAGMGAGVVADGFTGEISFVVSYFVTLTAAGTAASLFVPYLKEISGNKPKP